MPGSFDMLQDRARARRRARPLHGTLLASALLGIARLSGAADAASAAPSWSFPEQIGPLEYMGQQSLPDARTGTSYAYGGAGLALDLAIYPYRPEQLRDGIASKRVRRELQRAGREIHAATHARLVRESTVELGTRTHLAAREALYAPDHAAVSLAESYLWIAAAQERLYVMRLDVMRGFEEDGNVSRGEIMAALGDALLRGPQAPHESAPVLNVAILWDPATPETERKLWTVYLYTRAASAARASEEGGLAPGERVAPFEEEVRARRLAVNAFREQLRADPEFASHYFADLDRVDAAGYLREYVWRYLQQPSWTETPSDLRLNAFDDWRNEHLRDHVAVTHGKIALKLAAREVAQR